jgi:hypothetical protein
MRGLGRGGVTTLYLTLEISNVPMELSDDDKPSVRRARRERLDPEVVVVGVGIPATRLPEIRCDMIMVLGREQEGSCERGCEWKGDG